MAQPHPYRQYQTAQVQTAGPAQLTLMCYDGIARFLAQARAAMTASPRRWDEQSARIGRAQALLTELLNGLDFERGGRVARDLDTLYRYLYDRLTHANIKDDVAALDEVRAAAAELRDAWAEAMGEAAGVTAPPPAASEAPRRPAALALSV